MDDTNENERPQLDVGVTAITPFKCWVIGNPHSEQAFVAGPFRAVAMRWYGEPHPIDVGIERQGDGFGYHCRTSFLVPGCNLGSAESWWIGADQIYATQESANIAAAKQAGITEGEGGWWWACPECGQSCKVYHYECPNGHEWEQDNGSETTEEWQSE